MPRIKEKPYVSNLLEFQRAFSNELSVPRLLGSGALLRGSKTLISP
ncbi:MAG: hypothetical protein ACNY01_11870 [Desulfobacteria bacterium]